MFCPICGTELSEGAAFCGNCGNKIQQASTPAQQPAAAAQQTYQTQQPYQAQPQPYQAQAQYQAQAPYQGQNPYANQNPYAAGQNPYAAASATASQVPQAPYQTQSQNPSYYSAQTTQANVGVKSRTVAGVLAILLGGFGAQFFYLRHFGMGIACILLLFTVIVPFVASIFGIVQGIMMLTKSDAEFQRIWVVENKLFF